MSNTAQAASSLTIPEQFAERKGAKICLTFSDLLAKSEIKMALDMLEEHPWMVHRWAQVSKTLPIPFQNRPYLHIAVMLGDSQLLDAMLDKGAPIEQMDLQKRSAIFYAVQNAVGEDLESERMAHTLIKRGARCDGLTVEGDSLVYLKQGQISDDLFHALVERGAPLSLRKGAISLLTFMLSNSYELNQDDPDLRAGRITNPTMLAAMAETRLHRCRLRIVAGADANMHSGQVSDHPLHVALKHGDMNMANFLVAHGANPRLVDDHRNTFLHSNKNGPTAVRWLVDKGVDLEARNAWGETPLIYATRHIGRANGPNYDHVIALMVAGADMDARDYQGVGVSNSTREWLVHESAEAKGAHSYLDMITTCQAMKARQTAHHLLDELAEPASPRARP